MNKTTLESMILLSFKGVDPPPYMEAIAKRTRELAAVLGVDVNTLDEIVKRVETKLVTTMDEGVSLVDVTDNHNEDWVIKKENISWDYCSNSR